MEYRDWLILATIKEELNLSHTAQRLYITEPTISYRITNIEKELGTQILIRHPRGVLLTPKGIRLARYAEEMLTCWNTVKKEIQDIDNNLTGNINLGVSSTIAKYKIAPLLKLFEKCFPEIKVVIHSGSSTLLLPDLFKLKRIDVAIFRGNGPDTLSSKFILDEEPWVIITSHRIPLERLPTIPWIQYHSLIITHELEPLVHWWKETFHNLPYKAIMVDSTETCLQMVSYDFGWSIMPKIHIKNQAITSQSLHYQDGTPLLKKTLITYNQSKTSQAIIELFVQYIRRNYPRSR